MKAFAVLYTDLDGTTKTTEKVAALVRYFQQASPEDAAWAVYFLCGRKPRRLVSTRQLRTWARERVNLSEWLFEEAYDAVGDLAETIALLVPPGSKRSDQSLATWVGERLLPLARMTEAEQRDAILDAWEWLDTSEMFVWNKLITGAFRVGVSQQLVTRALSIVHRIPVEVIAHRLMGDWQPTVEFYQGLARAQTHDADASKPYPFCLAHALEQELESLGDISEWRLEWKWDGIRCQLIRRFGQTYVWTRGEELVTERYPELQRVGSLLPDGTVIDGEILPWKDNRPLPFAQLQRRIGRKTIGRKLLEEVPVILMAYDLLEWQGVDWRDQPFLERRRRLAELTQQVTEAGLTLSPEIEVANWEAAAQQRDASRNLLVEGLMLKRADSRYLVGRVRGEWWKWKIAPFTIDAVLIYAQRGHGKRASLYTDYTFGVWEEGKLVPIAKAYSGLTDAEIRQVDGFIRKHTVEKFGPVRTVKPELVFELAFEGIQRSSRHKSGIAVRFPRMLRWRTDKRPEAADRLEDIKRMLPPEHPA